MSDQAAQNYNVLSAVRDCLWVGWPGTYVDPGEQSTLRDKLEQDGKYVPVFLGKAVFPKEFKSLFERRKNYFYVVERRPYCGVVVGANSSNDIRDAVIHPPERIRRGN